MTDGNARERKDRLARNETIFREVNERVQEMTATSAADTFDFVCECGDDGCVAPIHLRLSEYEELRSDPLLFAVVPGHTFPEVERVVAETERFHTVRKDDEEGQIARRSDPRG